MNWSWVAAIGLAFVALFVIIMMWWLFAAIIMACGLEATNAYFLSFIFILIWGVLAAGIKDLLSIKGGSLS